MRSSQNINASYAAPLFVLAALCFGLFLGLALIAFFAHAPVFCVSMVGIFYVVGLYLTTDRRWRWHDAQEFENRFWTVVALMVSTALAYAKDSPVAIGRLHHSAGILFIVIFTLAVQYYDRKLHRLEISRMPKMKSSASAQSFGKKFLSYRATAEQKTMTITEALEQIDRTYIPSTISNMIHQQHVKRMERRIIRILTGASKDELNYIISHVTLALLFYKVKDHYGGAGELHRTMILDMLCDKRLADLSVRSRAIVLDALMVMKISAHKKSESWVRNIVLKTTGDDLSRLKTYTDTKADIHSMHKLVFMDLRTPEIRESILTHIRQQAAVQAAHMSLGTKRSRLRSQKAWRKVLSDVDDTLFSSGGRYPAGLDTLYPRHTLYPGVLTFYRELDLGTSGADEWESGRVGNLTFLSARPHVYKDVSEKKSYAKFEKLYEQKRMHTLPTLLAGCLSSGRAFMIQGDLEPMARRKFTNFAQYHQLYPEYTHIFIGDNGQADVHAAEIIVETFGTSVLEAGYFHLVQPIENTFGYDSHAISRWKRMNIFFFDTYVGAAVQAYRHSHILLKSLYRIAQDAIENFKEVYADFDDDDERRDRARVQLNLDLVKARDIFELALMEEYNEILDWYDEIPLIGKRQLYDCHTTVQTRFGRGRVCSYRSVEDIYQVELTQWKLRDEKHGPMAYLMEKELSLYIGISNNNDDSLNVGVLSYMRNKFGSTSNALVRIGGNVSTKFGMATIVYAREDHGIICCDMKSLTASPNPSARLYAQEGFIMDSLTSRRRDDSPTNTSPMFSGVRSGLEFLSKQSLSLFGATEEEDSATQFPVGSQVISPFGAATVVSVTIFAPPSAPASDLVAVTSDGAESINNTDEGILVSPKTLYRVSINSLGDTPTAYIYESSLKAAPAPPRIAVSGLLSPTASSRRLLSLLSFSNSKDMASPKAVEEDELVVEPDATVKTVFGQGTVLEFDKMKNVAKVSIGTSTAYVQKEYLEVLKKDVGGGYGSGILAFIRGGLHRDESKKEEEGKVRINDYVSTAFGNGYVVSVPTKNTLPVTVKINIGTSICTAYVQQDQVCTADVLPVEQEKKYSLWHEHSTGLGLIIGDTLSFFRDSILSSPRHVPEVATSDVEVLELAKPPCQTFSVGTVVDSPFGLGTVLKYNDSSTVYTLRTTVDNETNLKAHVQAVDCEWPTIGVAGERYWTPFGTGCLFNVRNSHDGVHELVSNLVSNSTSYRMFLSSNYVLSNAILIKACVGDAVQTPFGIGMVIKVYPLGDKVQYVVALNMNREEGSNIVCFYGNGNSIELLDEEGQQQLAAQKYYDANNQQCRLM